MQEHDHPFLNEEPLLDLSANVGNLESDQRVLVRQLTFFHRLELTLIEMEIVFIELEILLLELLV